MKESLEMTWREAKVFVKENPEYEIEGVEVNMPVRMVHMINFVKNGDFVKRIDNAKTQEDVFNILQEIPGLARFLAYQIFVDFTYIPEYKFSENEFTISGPGCNLGLDYLFLDRDGMNYEECLFWVKDNIEKEWEKAGFKWSYEELFDHLPEEDRCLNVMMAENSFCELGKTVKFYRNEGRPRNRYTPQVSVKPKQKGLF